MIEKETEGCEIQTRSVGVLMFETVGFFKVNFLSSEVVAEIVFVIFLDQTLASWRTLNTTACKV